MKKAAMNIHMQSLCEYTFVSIGQLDKYLAVQLLNHIVRLFLVLKESAKLYFKLAVAFFIPTSNESEFPLFYIHVCGGILF